MERERSTKVIAIVALLVGVIGLSVGFAAFSNTLNISSSATVNPDETTFNVDFSTSDTAVETDPITGVATPNTVTFGNGTIDNTTNPTDSGLKANFTAPGQKVVYSFYAYNAGQYVAYLKNITYANVAGKDAARVCTAAEGVTDALVQAACDDITLSVKVGSEAAVTGTTSNITSHSLATNAADVVEITIEYAADGDRSDGNFDVAFGDVSLEYRSVDK